MSYNKTVLILIFVLGISTCFGQIKLPKLISTGAILQRDTELKIWGWAAPHETVVLSFDNKKYNAMTDAKGNWQLLLPAQKFGGPYQMVFTGTNKITLNNIMFGDVWLCSGQSNMELPMQRLKDKYPKELAEANNPSIRQFLVPDQYDFNTVHNDLDSGSWKEANTQNIAEFSGVAYFFAKDLYAKFKVPIGLINAALGGSPVESWMSEDALKKFPDAYAELQQFKDSTYVAEIAKSDKKRQEDWYSDLNKKDIGFINGNEWFLDEVNDTGWEEMSIPGYWKNEPIGNVNGVVWFRKTVNVSKEMTESEASLWLGRIVDQDHVYVNGTLVGTTGYQYPPRKYKVPKGVLNLGKNTITIRVINEQENGGFVLDKPYFLAVESDTINLKGNWKYKLGATMNPLKGQTFIRWKAGGLYNKMIAPLLNYKIRGAIWYQGESNTYDPNTYASTFPALIANWRDKWQIGDFPFIYVQLANFLKETDAPTESNWALLRQAQLSTLSVSNTGMAVITDIGEWNDIHPINKKDVGKRLSQEAFRLSYGESKVSLCPVPEKAKFKKDKVEIEFKYADSGLKVKGGTTLHYFEISIDGIHFVKTSALIKGDAVVVWHSEIKNPKVVRYAWADNPAKANLFSNDDLPVSPFQIKK
ncbi:sialate O-acetylesterase [Algibacter sp. AS12]|uniref:sialate O-acetylesterase n=1 Tax=Algibacter sp. AS12 TaxID=3135773 RepID=UPI00398B760D